MAESNIIIKADDISNFTNFYVKSYNMSGIEGFSDAEYTTRMIQAVPDERMWNTWRGWCLSYDTVYGLETLYRTGMYKAFYELELIFDDKELFNETKTLLKAVRPNISDEDKIVRNLACLMWNVGIGKLLNKYPTDTYSDTLCNRDIETITYSNAYRFLTSIGAPEDVVLAVSEIVSYGTVWGNTDVRGFIEEMSGDLSRNHIITLYGMISVSNRPHEKGNVRKVKEILDDLTPNLKVKEGVIEVKEQIKETNPEPENNEVVLKPENKKAGPIESFIKGVIDYGRNKFSNK